MLPCPRWWFYGHISFCFHLVFTVSLSSTSCQTGSPGISFIHSSPHSFGYSPSGTSASRSLEEDKTHTSLATSEALPDVPQRWNPSVGSPFCPGTLTSASRSCVMSFNAQKSQSFSCLPDFKSHFLPASRTRPPVQTSPFRGCTQGTAQPPLGLLLRGVPTSPCTE